MEWHSRDIADICYNFASFLNSELAISTYSYCSLTGNINNACTAEYNESNIQFCQRESVQQKHRQKQKDNIYWIHESTDTPASFQSYTRKAVWITDERSTVKTSYIQGLDKIL